VSRGRATTAKAALISVDGIDAAEVLAAAREATGWLRRLKPEDPVAYDWPLSRLGILGLPMTLPAARA